MASGFKIISGGQNGADRIALEVAQEFGIPTGGTAPKGFRTSKGYDVSLRYAFHLKESKSWSYPSRTMQNVDDADATLIFQSRDSTGTKKTLGYCMTGKWVCPKRIPPIQPHRPYIIVDLLAPSAQEMIEKVQGFIREKVQTTLNVAGHTNVDGCEWNMLLRTFLRMTCQYLGGTPSSSFGIRSRATKKRKLEEESEIGSKELWPEIIDPALPAELNDVSLGAGLITARGMDPLTGRVIYRVSLVEPVVETIEDNPVQDDIYLVPSLELNSRGYTVEAIKPVQCIIFRFVLNIENEGSSLITVRYGMGSAVERTMTLAELKDQVASPTSCNAGLREAWSYFVRSHARFFSKHSLSAKHQISKAAQKVLSSSSSSSYYSSPSSSSLPPSEPIQGSIYSIPAEIPPDIFKVHQLVSSIHRP